MARLPKEIKPTRAGDVLLLTIPNYWGKGLTVDEARENVKVAGGRIGRYWRLRSVHPDTVVDGMGSLSYPIAHEPVFLAESNPETK